MSPENIEIIVKLFAIYQETYDREEITIKLPTNSKAEAVLDQILTDNPHLENWRSITKIAVNLEFVNNNYDLKSGDEVALIPPVSGG